MAWVRNVFVTQLVVEDIVEDAYANDGKVPDAYEKVTNVVDAFACVKYVVEAYEYGTVFAIVAKVPDAYENVGKLEEADAEEIYPEGLVAK